MVTASRSATRTTIFLLLSLKIMLASARFPFASANFTLKVVSSARLRLTTARVVRKTSIILFMCLPPREHMLFRPELVLVGFILVFLLFVVPKISALLLHAKRIKLPRRRNVSSSASWRQKSVLALLQWRKLDSEDSRRDLFGIIFFRVLLCTLRRMEDATGPGAEFAPVSLHVQPEQLIFGNRRAFRTANNEFRVTANL